MAGGLEVWMAQDELVELFVALNEKGRREGLLALNDDVIRYRLLASALEQVVHGRPPDDIRRAMEAEAGGLRTGAEAILRSRMERGRLTGEEAEENRRRRDAQARLIVDGALAVQEGVPAEGLRARLAPGRA
jgi:hypothetical protein